MNSSLLNLIGTILQLALQYAPELISDVELVISLLQSGQDPTAEQQAQIDAGLEKAHARLQSAGAGT